MAQAARPANPFSVAGVAVDASAESAAAARPVAIADGQRRAFAQLMRRLTLPDDHGRLPRASEAILNDAVAGFGIDEERTSATRYIGKITVQFRADAIRRLLQEARIPYSETTSRPVLVVPVWQTAEGVRIWEAENPWREAWQRRPETDSLVPLSIAPAAAEGGPSLERLMSGSDDLRALMRRGNYDDVLVATATLQQADPGNMRIDIYLQHQGPADFLNNLDMLTVTGGTLEETLLTAALDLTRRIEVRWKYATVIDLEKQGQLSVMAGFGSLAEWTRLRAALAAVPIVRKVDVLQLSHRDAQLLLDFYGEPAQLGTALAQRDIVLTQRDGYWEMRGRK
ncbi:MAG: DUF2066 domain-containing protein [Ferrovibrio sp.]|uniref:DUF2066 domain-containing protein n=1 Tax=Ferrovibrio sp. TaxID=1917215 RepID=UPI003919E494